MWQNTDQNNSKCGYFLRNGSAVGDDEYNNSKILYTLLKMRDLSNLNDLHNTQDVIDFKICLIKGRTILKNVIRQTN